VDDRLGQVTHEVLERAWLYGDPASFREGVLAAVEALSSVDDPVPEDVWSFDLQDPTNCPECRIPFDDDADSADDALCPWCGARRPGQLQELMWAEIKAMELAWPEAVGA
jgi:hypothetical protein